MAIRALDSQERFAQLCNDIQVSKAVFDSLVARGYKTPSELAYSIDDPETMKMLIMGILRDDQAPMGTVLCDHDAPDPVVLMHVEAGRLRRLHAERKNICAPISAAPGPSTGPVPVGGLDGPPPPRLSLESMTSMKKAFKRFYPGELLDSENTPGPWYWSKVYSMYRPGAQTKHIDLHPITSEPDEETLQERRGSRRPRSEMQSLLNMCFEYVLELNPHELSGTPW